MSALFKRITRASVEEIYTEGSYKTSPFPKRLHNFRSKGVPREEVEDVVPSVLIALGNSKFEVQYA